jgi:hypothetical protein
VWRELRASAIYAAVALGAVRVTLIAPRIGTGAAPLRSRCCSSPRA